MELSAAEQISGFITKGSSFLVALPAEPSLDSSAAALALQQYLSALGKTVQVVTQGGVPKSLSFLAGAENVATSLGGAGTLTIELDTSKAQLGELSYETKGSTVLVYLKAKDGSFAPSDVNISRAAANVDAVFVLGAQSFENLGSLFSENAELFFQTPKINIDINPNNEYFGTVNAVDVTSGAVSELVFELLTDIELTSVSEEVATALLTGVIANTGSFQGMNTTPDSLIRASELISLGARQQDIIKHLFKTKELPLLKLWGRALARLKTEGNRGYAYTVMNSGDFDKTDTDTSSIPSVLQEFIDNVSGFKVFGLLAEASGAVYVGVTNHPQLQMDRLLELLGFGPMALPRLPNGTEYVQVRVPGNLSEVEQRFVAALNELLPGQPNA